MSALNDYKPGCWVNVEGPSMEELDDLADRYKLDGSLLKDATDFYEAPRLEVDRNDLYIFTRFAFSDNDKISTAPLLFVLTSKLLLTLTPSETGPFEKRLIAKSEARTDKKIKLFLKLFTKINTDYSYHLHSINKQIRSISVKLETIKNRDIIQFVTFENSLNDFMSVLVPTNVILTSLLSNRHIEFVEEDKDLIEDLLLNNNQLIELSKSNLKTIVNIREAYSTIMTNNLNRVIKLFTSLTVILTIPTMIASIYGMNVALPFGASPNIFAGIIIFIVSISSFLVFLFLKMNWL